MKTKEIQPEHLKECCEKRQLNRDWIAANCQSVTLEEASELLGYQAKSGGIWLQGEGIQGQFKPDTPWKSSEEKKAPKYRSPMDTSGYDAIMPKHPKDDYYWTVGFLQESAYKIDGHPCLLITEGIFKAIAACSIDFPCFALLGVEMGLTSASRDPEGRRYLVHTLRQYARQGFGFILAFDSDIATKQPVQKALIKLAFQLQSFRVPVYQIPPWDESLGKGIDDYIVANGKAAFADLVATCQPVKINREELSDKPKRLSTVQLYKFIEDKYAKTDRLRFNELGQKIELDSQEYDCSMAYLMLAREHNIETFKGKAEDIFVEIAKSNPFDPVKEYLDRVAETVKPISLDNLSARYLNTVDPIYDSLLKKTLLAAVARIYQPGCKFDYALVLQGEQGIGKSSFFEILAGDWFDSSMGASKETDELMKLYKCWIQEWGEIERIFGKKAAGEIKAFLSRRQDAFRVPYGRATLEHKRRSIIVGSVNDSQFLVDQTGDRRYWVIPVLKQINLDLVEKDRDALWSALVHAYRSGEKWNPSHAEELAVKSNNEQFRVSDEWEFYVENYLLNKEKVVVGQILEEVFNFEPSKLDRASQMRVSAILTKLGWKRVGAREMDDGRRRQCWEKSQPLGLSEEVVISETLAIQSNSQPHNLSQPDLEVVTSQNPCCVRQLTTSQPSQPKMANLNNLKIDFSSYPHLTSNNLRAKEKRATLCKERMLDNTTRQGLQEFKANSGFSETEIKWVYKHYLTAGEKAKVDEAATIVELDLFSQPVISMDDIIAATNSELARLKWGEKEGRSFLISNYGKKSRHLLTDAELIDFLDRLKKEEVSNGKEASKMGHN